MPRRRKAEINIFTVRNLALRSRKASERKPDAFEHRCLNIQLSNPNSTRPLRSSLHAVVPRLNGHQAELLECSPLPNVANRHIPRLPD